MDAQLLRPQVELSPEEVRAEVARIGWFHHIDLGTMVTPGSTSLAHQEWIARSLPADFGGLSVLDVGAWDGYFSFLVERRGARRVLAIDELQNASAHADGTRGFELARRVLRSRVEYRVMSVEDAARIAERFDAILFLGVYYHLVDPVGGLRRLLGLLRPGGDLYLEGMYLPGRAAILRRFSEDEMEPTTFCGATLAGLEQIARAAGFEGFRVLATARGVDPITRWAVRHAAGFRSRLGPVARAMGGRSFWPRVLASMRRPVAPVGSLPS